MKSRAELKNALELAESKLKDATNNNVSLMWDLGCVQKEAKTQKVTITTLREELDKAEAKLTDSIREKALAFVTGDRVARRDAAVLQRAANYEMYLRKGVSVPVYTNDRSDIRSTLAWLFESATEEQAGLLSTLSGQVDDLQAAYKAALKENAERQETTEADVPTSTEAPMTPGAVKEAVISIMSRETGTMNLRAEVHLAHEWVTEKDDFQDRLSALAMADGNRAKAKVIYSLRRGEV